MFLIVSSADRLRARFRAPGLERVIAKVGAYVEALGSRGISTTRALLDDPKDMDPLGVKAVPIQSWRDAAKGIAAVAESLQRRGHTVTDLLILGGHAVLPFCERPNPVSIFPIDRDDLVWSDAPYGVAAAGAAADTEIADVGVGRIIDDGSRNPASLLTALDQAIAWNGNRALGPDGCVVTNVDWAESAHDIASRLPGQTIWRQSPGFRLNAANQADLERGYVYFNLHGFANRAVWSGYDSQNGRYVDAVTPRSLALCSFRNSVVICENCYGALVVNKTARTSCAMQVVASGAPTFLGPTGLSYGSYHARQNGLSNADALTRDFLRSHVAGMSAGEALYRAQQSRAASGSPFDRKTALQFVLYGDPTL